MLSGNKLTLLLYFQFPEHADRIPAIAQNGRMADVVNTLPDRPEIMKEWLDRVLGGEAYSLTPLSGDASFRRYFRVHYRNSSLVVMDAPPDRESTDAFLRTTRQLRLAHVHAPAVHASSVKLGFILMEDLGDALFLNVLRNDRSQANRLYGLAIKELAKIRGAGCSDLPEFDASALTDEMRLFIDWYCGRHLGVRLGRNDLLVLETGFQRLVDNALGQPQVYTHRDYHSRNLILTSRQTVGVLDHQDAVCGPLSYDLVSLLRDVYIVWPHIMVANWMRVFYQAWMNETGNIEISARQTETWFDLTALQRHLKIAGIFARLAYRDGKTQFLDDIPATMRYIMENVRRYPEFEAMHRLLRRLHQPMPP